tara:strand:+ start:384 stop:659 length:276 start_codon:yes stop_codon:yes gene_type:complete
MFEAFVLVCLMGTNNICHTLQDLEGPYKTEKQCTTRAYEIAMELPEYMPNYYALKYKCMIEKGKVKTNHDTEKEKRQFKGVHRQEWRQETH